MGNTLSWLSKHRPQPPGGWEAAWQSAGVTLSLLPCSCSRRRHFMQDLRLRLLLHLCPPSGCCPRWTVQLPPPRPSLRAAACSASSSRGDFCLLQQPDAALLTDGVAARCRIVNTFLKKQPLVSMEHLFLGVCTFGSCIRLCSSYRVSLYHNLQCLTVKDMATGRTFLDQSSGPLALLPLL